MFSDPQVPLVHFDVQTLPIPRTHTCRTTCNKQSSACVSESRQLAQRRRPWAFGDRRTLPIAWTHRCLHATKNTGGEHVSLNARSWQIEGGTGHLGGSENIAAPRHTCRTTFSSILTTCVSESKQLANRRAHWSTLVDRTHCRSFGRQHWPLAAMHTHTLCCRQCWPPCKRTCKSEMHPSRFDCNGLPERTAADLKMDWRLVGVRRGGPHPIRRTIFANDPCEIQPTNSVSSSAS